MSVPMLFSSHYWSYDHLRIPAYTRAIELIRVRLRSSGKAAGKTWSSGGKSGGQPPFINSGRVASSPLIPSWGRFMKKFQAFKQPIGFITDLWKTVLHLFFTFPSLYPKSVFIRKVTARVLAAWSRQNELSCCRFKIQSSEKLPYVAGKRSLSVEDRVDKGKSLSIRSLLSRDWVHSSFHKRN